MMPSLAYDLDSRMKVELVSQGTSPKPIEAIWVAQHVCVAEEAFSTELAITTDKAAQIIIDRQLNTKHFSVLKFAFASVLVSGFSHDAIMQWVRHQDACHLVQSNRYTGNRFVKVAKGELDIEECFYFRPEGYYTDRQGSRYFYSKDDIQCDKEFSKLCCDYYAKDRERGVSEEHARYHIPMNCRQNYIISATLETWFHIWDQRSLKDAQLESRVLCELTFNLLKDNWCPQLLDWYYEKRWSKNLLAP